MDELKNNQYRIILEALEVDRQFQIGPQIVTALGQASVSIHNEEFLVITGPSGSGKSTLLNILSGLDCPSHGEVKFKGESLSGLTMQRRAHLRNQSFGFIFQTPHLLMDKTVLENVLLPFHYSAPVDIEMARAKCLELLHYVDLVDMADRYPNTLSGGEMQRVVFARALCLEPEVIFADEPTGSLDAANSKRILQLLKEQGEYGRTVIMVTHDPEAISYGSATLHLSKFSMVQ